MRAANPIVGAALMFVIASALPCPLLAQMTKPAANVKSLPGNSWASIEKLPDFYTGVWEPSQQGFGTAAAANAKPPPLTPAWTAKNEAIRTILRAGGDVPSRIYHCIPSGFPNQMAGPEQLLAFSFTPGRVVISKADASTRHIYIDGRPLPEDPDDSFEGISIGHWDGDSLVVETAGLDPGNEFIYGLSGGKSMHVIEHMALKGKDVLQIDTALTAPEALTETYNTGRAFARHSDWSVIPFDCAQNNRDVDPTAGRQQFDLTPPK